ncbi:MAG: isoprenylcysteine carboxylmethyltransferase family protein [Blautia sp.]|nr:isoprenylcysteine carboxylmethyltransferase family protein [Blautia sp.]
MDKKLMTQALTKLLMGFIFILFILFVPAGTLIFGQAWLLVGLLLLAVMTTGRILLIIDPDLLALRLKAEGDEEERQTVGLLVFLLACALALAGLNYRFSWYVLPGKVSCAGAVLFVLAYGFYMEVFRENSFLSRTIEIQKGQKVIDTGLYRAVRHPMYLSVGMMSLAVPLILGSPWSLILTLGYFPVIGCRIRCEEQVLAEKLEGYSDYMRKVRYRLIPFLW